MRDYLVLLIFLSLAPTARTQPAATVQPANCAPDPRAPIAVPMELNLGGRPGVPPGVSGQIYVAVPLTSGGMTCTDQRPPPRDILRGEPGDVLRGA